MSRFDPETLERALKALRESREEAQKQRLGVAKVQPSASAFQDSSVELEMPSDEAFRIAAALCRKWEGLHLRPYLCPAGIPTIGYGSTIYPNGTKVTLKDYPITEEIADAMLLHDLRTVRLPAVRQLCPHIDTPRRLAAILDFSYNLGTGALAASTLRKRINANRWVDVPSELRKWVYAGGRKLLGLIRRRDDEVRLV